MGYVFPAEKGKQCKDCKSFDRKDEQTGKCFGKEVKAEGGCDFFTAKAK